MLTSALFNCSFCPPGISKHSEIALHPATLPAAHRPDSRIYSEDDAYCSSPNDFRSVEIFASSYSMEAAIKPVHASESAVGLCDGGDAHHAGDGKSVRKKETLPGARGNCYLRLYCSKRMPATLQRSPTHEERRRLRVSQNLSAAKTDCVAGPVACVRAGWTG